MFLPTTEGVLPLEPDVICPCCSLSDPVNTSTNQNTLLRLFTLGWEVLWDNEENIL